MTFKEDPVARWNKILGRRISFGPDGFPRQVANRDGLARAPFKVAAFGTVALAATSAAWVMHGHSTVPTTGDAASAPRSAVVASPVTGSTGAHAGAPSDKIVSTHKAAHAKPSGTTPATTKRPASPSTPSRGSGGSPAGSASATTPTASPSAPAAGTGAGGGSTSNAVGSSALAPTEGTLSVSTNNITLAVGSSSSFTLTANGGPVNWSISVPSGLLGSVAVSRQSGTLEAGQSATITVTGTGIASVGSRLTISPGGQTVTVGVSLL
jgi:hypothetical protein